MSKEDLKPFKPGQSGNPKGKPKGTLSMTTLLRAALDKKFKRKNPFTGKMENLPFCEWVNVGLLAKAMKGDVKAVTHIYERIDGKVAQQLFGSFDVATFNPAKLSKEELEAIVGRQSIDSISD